MSYGMFIDDIAHRLKEQVLAYDSLPDCQGFILYLRGRLKQVEIEAAAIYEHKERLVSVLRDLILEHTSGSARARIFLHDGRLTVER